MFLLSVAIAEIATTLAENSHRISVPRHEPSPWYFAFLLDAKTTTGSLPVSGAGGTLLCLNDLQQPFQKKVVERLPPESHTHQSAIFP